MSINSNFTADSITIDSDIIETVIGLNTKFKGSVNTDKIIRIDGEYEGEIESTAKIIVSETGKLKGTVTCTELQLDGSMTGTLTCTECLRIAPIGKFNGDAAVKNIVISEGSLFEGTCTMQRLR